MAETTAVAYTRLLGLKEFTIRAQPSNSGLNCQFVFISYFNNNNKETNKQNFINKLNITTTTTKKKKKKEEKKGEFMQRKSLVLRDYSKRTHTRHRHLYTEVY